MVTYNSRRFGFRRTSLPCVWPLWALRLYRIQSIAGEYTGTEINDDIWIADQHGRYSLFEHFFRDGSVE